LDFYVDIIKIHRSVCCVAKRRNARNVDCSVASCFGTYLLSIAISL